LHVKSFKLFIRKENFNYTFVLDKVDNEISKEMFAAFDFPGAFFEDDKFIYYRGIDKEDLFRWAESL
jgi:hypothetical protein